MTATSTDAGALGDAWNTRSFAWPDAGVRSSVRTVAEMSASGPIAATVYEVPASSARSASITGSVLPVAVTWTL